MADWHVAKSATPTKMWPLTTSSRPVVRSLRSALPRAAPGREQDCHAPLCLASSTSLRSCLTLVSAHSLWAMRTLALRCAAACSAASCAANAGSWSDLRFLLGRSLSVPSPSASASTTLRVLDVEGRAGKSASSVCDWASVRTSLLGAILDLLVDEDAPDCLRDVEAVGVLVDVGREALGVPPAGRRVCAGFARGSVTDSRAFPCQGCEHTWTL